MPLKKLLQPPHKMSKTLEAVKGNYVGVVPPSHPTPNPYALFQFVQNPTCVLKALKHIDHNFNKDFTSIKSQVKSIWHFPSTPLHLLPKAPSLDQFASTIV